MIVEEELRKIDFSSLSQVREELLRRILFSRRINRESDRELEMEELNSVSAAKGNYKIREEYLK